ncbi:hypothetical protein [Dyadobacter sp. CY323]|uniref:hypothetical protein n=1 Tax=Dyadobacter sp. CY323 TaxID=2907302 RepID=UPI001F3E3BEB|nr:hypothetical protein [Dyadobacter sp. CY323]MCE6991970.1 hypothetical protein [Dyadobacter sp. CY323]
MRYLLLITLILFLESCREDKMDPVVSTCYSYANVRRAETVVDAPVTVRLSGGLITGSQLMASGTMAWGSCNLAREFMQDSLAIYVTGYFLTSPQLEVMNITPVPFVVTSARIR